MKHQYVTKSYTDVKVKCSNILWKLILQLHSKVYPMSLYSQKSQKSYSKDRNSPHHFDMTSVDSNADVMPSRVE